MMQPEDKKQEIAERAERLQEIGSSILRAARDELYLGMRFLDVALSSFSYQMDGQVHGFGTDGRVMYFQPQMLGGLYRENRILVNRGYLHMVFHCIFRHFQGDGKFPFAEDCVRNGYSDSSSHLSYAPLQCHNSDHAYVPGL